MDCFLGTILLWAANYAPAGWAFCDGKLLQIKDYQALYSLLGHIYGGDFNALTFALPDLRSRVPVGAYSPGSKPSPLLHYNLGQQEGAENFNLKKGQIPGHVHPLVQHTHPTEAHNHTINSSSDISFDSGIPANTDPGDTATPSTTTCFAIGTAGGKSTSIYNTKPSTLTMSSKTVNTTVRVTGATGNNLASDTGNAHALKDGKLVEFKETEDNSYLGLPISVIQPSLALNYIICIEGIYPPRP